MFVAVYYCRNMYSYNYGCSLLYQLFLKFTLATDLSIIKCDYLKAERLSPLLFQTGNPGLWTINEKKTSWEERSETLGAPTTCFFFVKLMIRETLVQSKGLEQPWDTHTLLCMIRALHRSVLNCTYFPLLSQYPTHCSILSQSFFFFCSCTQLIHSHSFF